MTQKHDYGAALEWFEINKPAFTEGCPCEDCAYAKPIIEAIRHALKLVQRVSEIDGIIGGSLTGEAETQEWVVRVRFQDGMKADIFNQFVKEIMRDKMVEEVGE